MLGSQRSKLKLAQDFIQTVKIKPCLDCGFIPTVPDQMDFDHVRGNKVFNVAKMVAQGSSIDKIKSEIAKCDLVCANCHRLRTYKRRKLNSDG